MTSTRSGVMTPTFPPGRYGHRREPRAMPRWLFPLLVAGVLVAGLAVAVGYYQRYGVSEYQAQILRFDAPTASKVTMTFRVTKPAGQPAECVVRSRSYDGIEVGRATVPVQAGPAGAGSVDVSYDLRTKSRGATAEVEGCGPTR
jgi:hypothetical protein